MISIDGTRSYGAGLARAAGAAGLVVTDCEQPTHRTRRGKGKSDPIDAHLTVLASLRLVAAKLPAPRGRGPRGTCTSCCTHGPLTTTATGQANRLRDGDDHDRELARGPLSAATLTGLARDRRPCDATWEQAVHHGEIRRLALGLQDGARALTANKAQLAQIVADLAPGLRRQPGIGRSAPHRPSCRSPTPDAAADAAFARLAGASPSRHPAARPPATDSTAAATARSTKPSTSPRWGR